jgi:hypothetical protein
MRLGLLVALLLVVASGSCNSKPTAAPDGGGNGGGSGGSAGGGGGAGASEDSGVCANLACLQTLSDLVVGCTAGGSCMYQSDRTSTPMTDTECYDNGVHTLMTTESSTGSTITTVTLTFKVKKNGALCFSKNYVDSFPTGAEAGTDVTGDAMTLDGSGTLVATVHSDPSGVVTVTCPGGPPTVLVDSCGFSRLIVGAAYLRDSTASNCTLGTCSF